MKSLLLILIAALTVGVMAGVAIAQPASGSIDIRLNVFDDDNEEFICDGSYRSNAMTSSDIELGYDHENPAGCGAAQLVGLRFRNVEIPAGATITKAYVQFSVDETDTRGECTVDIYGELNANPAAFQTATTHDISLRTSTAAVVNWVVPDWPTTHVMGPDQQTPDLSSVIYEIVSLSGWASGNAIVIIVIPDPDVPEVGHRAAEAVDGTGSEAALLHVEYSTGVQPIYPVDGGWVIFDDMALELQWQRQDPNGPAVLPVPYNVDVYLGLNSSLLVGDRIEENQDIDSTANFVHPLIDATTYYWRVDVYDPNDDVRGGRPVIIEGPTWSFETVVPAEIYLIETDNDSTVDEQEPLSNTDDIILTLSKDPGAFDVNVTFTEVLTPVYPSVNRLEMESHNGEAAAAPELQVTHSGGTVVTSKIAESQGDMEEDVADGTADRGSTDLEIFSDGSSHQIIGLRFTNVVIPQGATINSAVVEFEVDVAHATAKVYGFITGEKVADASQFVIENFHMADRLAANPTTAVSTLEWTDPYAVDAKVLTQDIAPVIEEIVGQAGWVSGQSLVIFLTEVVNYEPADIEFIGVASTTYTLDSSNWDTGVTVTIAAIDDDVTEPNPEMITLITTASSTDSQWEGLAVNDVIVNVLDNECGAWGFDPYDFNQNCYVALDDLAMIAAEWQGCSTPNDTLALCVDYR